MFTECTNNTCHDSSASDNRKRRKSEPASSQSRPQSSQSVTQSVSHPGSFYPIETPRAGFTHSAEPPRAGYTHNAEPPRAGYTHSAEPPRAGYTQNAEPPRAGYTQNAEPPRTGYTHSPSAPRSVHGQSVEPPRANYPQQRKPLSSSTSTSSSPSRSKGKCRPDLLSALSNTNKQRLTTTTEQLTGEVFGGLVSREGWGWWVNAFTEQKESKSHVKVFCILTPKNGNLCFKKEGVLQPLQALTIGMNNLVFMMEPWCV